VRAVRRSLGPSPTSPGCSRLTVAVQLESRPVELEYWFEFPDRFEGDVTDRDDPLAVLVAPLGAFFGEDIVIDGAVDRRLLRNVRGALQIWDQWFDECSAVTIDATTEVDASPPAAPRTLACFSGGIDSYFTLGRHHRSTRGDGTNPIDALVSLAGFNTPMEGFAVMTELLRPVAERFDVEFVPVLTNVRYGGHVIETPYSQTDWMVRLSHGAVLASVGHIFGARSTEFLIPSTFAYSEGDAFKPWGSSVVVDRLFSSSALSVVHDGAATSRLEKTREVASRPEMLREVHVCFRDWDLGNCSRCDKCLRNMAVLDILGRRDDATSFDWTKYSQDGFGMTIVPKDLVEFYRSMENEARRVGKTEFADKIHRAIRRSPARALAKQLKRRIRPVLVSNPLGRALAQRRAARVAQQRPGATSR
jgi:hypothetical protein